MSKEKQQQRNNYETDILKSKAELETQINENTDLITKHDY